MHFYIIEIPPEVPREISYKEYYEFLKYERFISGVKWFGKLADEMSDDEIFLRRYIDVVDCSNNTLLIYYCYSSKNDIHLGKIKKLIEAGADIDKRNNSGWSALVYATMHKNLQIIKLLIAHGADVNFQLSPSGYSALIHAAYTNADHIKVLLKAGADVNAVADGYKTALLVAVVDKNDVSSVKLLLKAGADTSYRYQKYFNGKTILEIAKLKTREYSGTINNQKIIRLLKAHNK
jgi:ankyrin repeat protein